MRIKTPKINADKLFFIFDTKEMPIDCVASAEMRPPTKEGKRCIVITIKPNKNPPTVQSGDLAKAVVDAIEQNGILHQS